VGLPNETLPHPVRSFQSWETGILVYGFASALRSDVVENFGASGPEHGYIARLPRGL
jgi:hypothetical protein